MEVERVVRDSEDLMMDDFEDSIEIEQELWVAGGESLSKEGAVSDIGNLSEGSLNSSSVDFGEDDIFDTDDLVVVLGLAGEAGGEDGGEIDHHGDKKDRNKGKDRDRKKHRGGNGGDTKNEEGRHSKSKDGGTEGGRWWKEVSSKSKSKSSRSKSKEKLPGNTRGATFDPLTVFAQRQEQEQVQMQNAEPEPEQASLDLDANTDGVEEVTTASLIEQMKGDLATSSDGPSGSGSGSGSVATLRASFEASTPADAANGRKSVEVGMDAEARRRTKFKMAFTQLREDVTASVDVDNLEVEEDLESPASLGSASTISPGIRSLISPSSNQASANKARSLASPPDDANVASCAVHECCQQGRLACN